MSSINNNNYSLIITCAGISKRFNGENKLLYQIDSKPVLYYTLSNFLQNIKFDDIIITAQKSQIDLYDNVIKTYFTNINNIKIIEGGNTRFKSVTNAVHKTKNDIVFVHDGARPNVKKEMLDRLISEFINNTQLDCVLPATNITDTIKFVDKNNMLVKKTVDRSQYVTVQTPQIFKKKKYLEGLEFIKQNNISVDTLTDDASLIELVSKKIKVVSGDQKNIKITYNSDIDLLKKI